MNTIRENLPDQIAFIADAHLGMPGSDSARSKNFAEFLRWLNGKISHLYIVGDLFDFWFEYKSVVPNICPHVIFELYNLARTGTKVVLFAGNHDYWLGPYLSTSVGLEIELDDIVVTHQNLKIYIYHGDGLDPKGHGYRIMKKVLRNKLSIRLFSLLHPDLATLIARITSKISRYYSSSEFEEKNMELFRNIGDKCLKDGFDAVVYGHSHVHLVEERFDGTLVLLGDWINHNTYVFLENGKFTIHKWK